MQLRSVLRTGVAVAATAAALAVPAAPASAQAAEFCPGYITLEAIQIPGFVNCTVDAVGNFIVRVGDCLFFYDPLFSPIPSRVVPETVEFVNCL